MSILRSVIYVKQPCSASFTEPLFARPPVLSLSLSSRYNVFSQCIMHPTGTAGFFVGRWNFMQHLYIPSNIPFIFVQWCICTSAHFKVTIFNQPASRRLHACVFLKVCARVFACAHVSAWVCACVILQEIRETCNILSSLLPWRHFWLQECLIGLTYKLT